MSILSQETIKLHENILTMICSTSIDGKNKHTLFSITQNKFVIKRKRRQKCIPQPLVGCENYQDDYMLITLCYNCILANFLPAVLSLWNQETHPSHLALQMLCKLILNKWRMKWINRSTLYLGYLDILTWSLILSVSVITLDVYVVTEKILHNLSVTLILSIVAMRVQSFKVIVNLVSDSL